MRYLLAIVAIVITMSIVPRAYAESFSFHNGFSYRDETGILHVLGEVKNESDTEMRNVLIKASFYDMDGNLLDEFQRSPKLQVINPGDSSPFEIQYIDSQADSVANFTLSATGQQTEPKEKQLEIISSSSRLDVLGIYYINAVAKNEGQEIASNAIMIATLYDAEGRVVAIGEALAEAGPGSSNMTAGSEAAFGIVVTDKLQTYKTARYSLVVDSNRYMSETVVLTASGPGLSSGNQTQSGCLIATAAFGSELAPQVQQLRMFRDDVALQTSAGSSFMNVFNAWYYSFSPSVADYERQAPWLQNAVRISIYPLLGILALSTAVYDSLAFNSELGIMAAGITASSLVGLLYFAPVGAAVGIVGRKRRWSLSRAKLALVCTWTSGAVAVVVALAGLAAIDAAMMLGTTLLVLSAMSTAVIAVARAFKS